MVVVAGGRRLLQDQDDGDGFEARRDKSSAQRGVKDAREDVCELLISLSQEDTLDISTCL